MNVLKCFLFAFFLAYSLTAVAVVHAQDDQSGFISIDCGLPEDSNYTDPTTGINYRSDAGFTTSGESKSISPNSKGNYQEKLFSTVRSFPNGTRNCYTLKPSLGKGYKYLIRASFMYGNYDSRNQLPTFDLTLGAATWGSVTITNASTPVTAELIHVPSSDYIHVCLLKTGLTTPFISALELRPLSNTSGMYKTDSGSLQLFVRANFDSNINKEVRYKDDEYDRIWAPYTLDDSTTISTLLDIGQNIFEIPSAVMRSCNTPDTDIESLSFGWDVDNSTTEFYIYMHFAEVQVLSTDQLREFNIYLNGKLWSNDGSVVPKYLRANSYYSLLPETGYSKYEFSLNKTFNSTLPPIINALEIYTAKKFSSLETDDRDVDAIVSVKTTYGVTRDWQGDPCAPEASVWVGLSCSYHGFDPARIISLDLSKSGLTSEIAPSISNLTKLKSLDLSNNKLTGQVPDFLSQLASLSVLNLKGNNFTGPVPAQLLEKSKNGLLSLSIDGQESNTNTDPCQSKPCKKKKAKTVLPIVAAVVSVLVVLLGALLFGIWMIRRRKQRVVRKVDAESNNKEGEIERKDRRFSYSEVLSITNNFQRVLGKGGFGTVYHGFVGDTQVAVKMLSPSSTQGYKEFQAEASLLMSVHHKNLSSLVGYCNEGTNMGIIYEYMANGNFDEHLSGRGSNVLGWEARLRIAMDAAQGLEYLHHGCKPPIIHRDVKTSNILLTENYQAKLADFGLSRAYPLEGGTHVSTVVAGTPGYLDPDYYTSNRLTEKSDVYSFGIVLLEMITGQPAISRNQDKAHIVQWVDSIVRNGDVKQVVDPKFRGDFDVNSVWKAVELAMTCASRNSSKRPTMNFVVMELKECLATEIATRGEESQASVGVGSTNLESTLGPQAR